MGGMTAKITADPDGPGDLCGYQEAAAILGVEPQRISRYQRNGTMPTRYAKLRSGPVWLRRDVEALAKRRAEDEQRREEERERAETAA